MNIIDYVEYFGDYSFKERPFNEVDNIIFSCLAYVDFNGIVPESRKILTIEEAYGIFKDTYKPNLSTKANANDSNQTFVAGDITTTTFTDDDQGETWKFPGGSSANADHSIASEDYVDNAISNIDAETWTFTLSDNSTVTKTVLLG